MDVVMQTTSAGPRLGLEDYSPLIPRDLSILPGVQPQAPPVHRARAGPDGGRVISVRVGGVARLTCAGPVPGGVAQLARALRSHRRGRGFESHHLHWRELAGLLVRLACGPSLRGRSGPRGRWRSQACRHVRSGPRRVPGARSSGRPAGFRGAGTGRARRGRRGGCPGPGARTRGGPAARPRRGRRNASSCSARRCSPTDCRKRSQTGSCVRT